MTSNIIFIEFLNKKNLPPGVWMSEPDFCQWESFGLTCIAIRDMKLGIWKGLVGLPKEHKAYGKSCEALILEDWGMNLDVHGGVCISGKLPTKQKDLNKELHWIGFECCKGEDLLPSISFKLNDPILEMLQGNQTYKDLKFVRKETNNLARQLVRIK